MNSSRLFFILSICAFVVGCAAGTSKRSLVSGAYIRPDYSSVGITESEQYNNFKPGEVIHCSVETKQGYRAEWYYEGKLRSKESYFKLTPWKSSDLKVYIFDASTETSSTPADSAIWRLEIRWVQNSKNKTAD